MDTTTMNSPLVFGAMLLGTRIDQERSFALLDRFVERGGQWVDTANCYTFWLSGAGAGGASEEMLGSWLSAHPGLRDQIRLSTKVGAEPLWPGSWPQQREGLSRRAILQGLETSLQRLGVAEVDMFWLHQEDRSTPMAETVEALGELTSTGKVRRVGASNHPAWRVEQARGLARAGGTDASQEVQYCQPGRSGIMGRARAARGERDDSVRPEGKGCAGPRCSWIGGKRSGPGLRCLRCVRPPHRAHRSEGSRGC
ncbi:aldo/keto reductase [Pseudactinotalea sp. Z1748]|uniref:aldo/keto reductase n=1 Tax=Pseudactinotalea sp. Z1748 TaxID=3413027 RepID=UPI003C7AC00E